MLLFIGVAMFNSVVHGNDLLPLLYILLLVLLCCWCGISAVWTGGCSVALGCLLRCGGFPLWLL